MIKFTLITVTYNAEETLERTLQSVAEQTYPHIEHILIESHQKLISLFGIFTINCIVGIDISHHIC